MLPRTLTQLLWRALAVLCMVLGLVGVFVPVLPTVPFLLVAAWAGSRGWPALERWLLNHPRHGEPIRRWRSHGIVPRRAKVAATLTMLASALVLSISPVPSWLQLAAPALMAVVALWLWQRPER